MTGEEILQAYAQAYLIAAQEVALAEGEPPAGTAELMAEVAAHMLAVAVLESAWANAMYQALNRTWAEETGDAAHYARTAANTLTAFGFPQEAVTT